MSRYRPDIDGLRAVAIVPVVLYHAGFSAFSGGFVGVDVFFVISGYLITSIILAEIDGGTFSLARFYERRIRRIFPAFFAVLAFCLLVSTWLLLPADLAAFAKSAEAATLFASNVIFGRASGYFDSGSELKPLLHTWSLAVEEQFYLLFPFSLIVVRRYLRRSYISIAIAVVLVSFVWSAFGVRYDREAAFYLAPSRAWELGIGALLAMGAIRAPHSRILCNGLAVAGLGLIAYSVFAYTGSTPFPGPAAVLPCAGTALLIVAGAKHGSVVNSVLGWRPFVLIGLISYSLYLWHWPVLVFAKYYAIRPLHQTETLAALAFATIAAVMSWRYVERPFRGKSGLLTRRQLFRGSGIVMASSVAIAASLVALHGLPGRLEPGLMKALTAASSRKGAGALCHELNAKQVRAHQLCRIGDPHAAEVSFLVWGDSHTRSLTPELDRIASKDGRAGVIAMLYGCPPIIGVTRERHGRADECAPFSMAMEEFLVANRQIRDVLLVGRWGQYAEGSRYKHESGSPVVLGELGRPEDPTVTNYEAMARGLNRTVEFVRSQGMRVWVLGPIPEVGWNVPSVVTRAARQGRTIDIAPTLDEFYRRQARVLPLLDGLQRSGAASVLYPHTVLCGASNCPVSDAGAMLYLDDDHLSVAGASRLGPVLRKMLSPDTASPGTGN